jgi:hypothetical protein
MQDKEPYAPDGTWIHIEEGHAPYFPTHGVNAEAYFPDVLRLPRGGGELGWRTGDEGTDGRPTTRPCQVFACDEMWSMLNHSPVKHGNWKSYWRRGWDVSGGSPAVEPTPPGRGRDLNSGACLSRALGRSATPAEVL